MGARHLAKMSAHVGIDYLKFKPCIFDFGRRDTLYSQMHPALPSRSSLERLFRA